MVLWFHRFRGVSGFMVLLVSWCQGFHGFMCFVVSWVSWCQWFHGFIGFVMSMVSWFHSWVKRLAKRVRYTEVSFFRGSFTYIFLLLGERNSFVIPRTSLYRGSTIHMPTPPPSHLHHFEHLYLQFTRSINIGAFVSWGRGGGRINNAAIYTQICIYHRRPCSHVKQTKNR